MEIIQGFAFSGFRSFASDDLAVLYPLAKINLIAGQNNAGKSNVLRVVMGVFGERSTPDDSDSWDRPLFEGARRFRRYQAVPWEEFLVGPRQAYVGVAENMEFVRLFVEGVDDPSGPRDDDGTNFWTSVVGGGAIDQAWVKELAVNSSDAPYAGRLAQALVGTYGGSRGDDAQRVLGVLLKAAPLPPKAFMVSGTRAITTTANGNRDLIGGELKRRLLELQNPSSDRLADKDTFLKIQDFVRAVMEDSTVTIDIPHDLATVHVTQGGRTLPIESVGTGIHEVVILAAAATVVQDSIMCIEEPEVHLHPLLQRKLLRYLAESTSNQYFIATHSAHLLDAELGSIFHVTCVEGRSSLRYVGSARERSDVCGDLGYRPSDLVQTNAVLWVEGPSDRIYLKHWIDKSAPGRFLEGTHYSIMFYGGSLLNAVSPLDDVEIEDFISLRKLNRYMAVLIDSDRKSARAAINAHKRRVIDGLSEAGDESSLAWLTKGYTVENYVPENVLNAAIARAHPSVDVVKLPAMAQYENPLAADRVGLSSVSKVAIAKQAVADWGDDWPLDLKAQVSAVIQLIERANSSA